MHEASHLFSGTNDDESWHDSWVPEKEDPFSAYWVEASMSLESEDTATWLKGRVGEWALWSTFATRDGQIK
jgi:hypothetical protein